MRFTPLQASHSAVPSGVCTMLRTTPLTIAEVAYATGFESQGYFSRVFKRVMGMAPSDFRKSRNSRHEIPRPRL